MNCQNSRTQFVPPEVATRVIERAGEPAVYYSIFVPDNYTHSKPVPLVLALHFGGDPEGAGRAVLEILVAQAFQDLGAVIVAPDSKGGSLPFIRSTIRSSRFVRPSFISRS
jgi:hypothetical protein